MALLLFCLLGANIYYTFKQPYAGLTIEKKGLDWIVSSVDQNGMVIRNGVRRGDRILAVNNRPPEDFFNLKWGELEGFESIEIAPPSGQPTIISLGGESFSAALFNDLPFLLLSMAFFALGLMVLIRPRNQAAAREIFWLNVTIAMAIVVSPISARGILPAKLIEITCFGCFSFLLVRFAAVYSDSA